MVGKHIYGFSDHRDSEGRGGLPKNWRAYEVVGETKVSWIVGYSWNPMKVNKKTFASKENIRFVKTLEDIAKLEFIWDNQYKISQSVGRCNDYDKLKEIQRILEG